MLGDYCPSLVGTGLLFARRASPPIGHRMQKRAALACAKNVQYTLFAIRNTEIVFGGVSYGHCTPHAQGIVPVES